MIMSGSTLLLEKLLIVSVYNDDMCNHSASMIKHGIDHNIGLAHLNGPTNVNL